MPFIYNYSLKSLNTFGIDVQAKQFARFGSIQQLNELLDEVRSENNLLILGGGSNMLFTRNYEGTVLKNEIPGIELIKEDDAYYYVKCGAGVVWHELVMHCVERNFQGIENLALIPGCAGAAPMQNIGAYGVELKDLFHELEAVEIASGKLYKFDLSACSFGYRESVFKHEAKNKFVIVSLTLRLNKKPAFNISYGNIAEQLEKKKATDLSMRLIAEAVIDIRSSKLPDPKFIGNAGSFFKNPEVEFSDYENLKKEYPALVGYKLDNGKVKLAAGWLIEAAGWKGRSFGNYGVHKNQALVLVNHGGARGEDIFRLSEEIIQAIKHQFGVVLQREVNIY